MFHYVSLKGMALFPIFKNIIFCYNNNGIEYIAICFTPKITVLADNVNVISMHNELISDSTYLQKHLTIGQLKNKCTSLSGSL